MSNQGNSSSLTFLVESPFDSEMEYDESDHEGTSRAPPTTTPRPGTNMFSSSFSSAPTASSYPHHNPLHHLHPLRCRSRLERPPPYEETHSVSPSAPPLPPNNNNNNTDSWTQTQNRQPTPRDEDREEEEEEEEEEDPLTRDPSAYTLIPFPANLTEGWHFYSATKQCWWHYNNNIFHDDSDPHTPPKGWSFYHPFTDTWCRGALLNNVHLHTEAYMPPTRDLIGGWYYFSPDTKRWWGLDKSLNPVSRTWYFFSTSKKRWVSYRKGVAVWCPCCRRDEDEPYCQYIGQDGSYKRPWGEGPTINSPSKGGAATKKRWWEHTFGCMARQP